MVAQGDGLGQDSPPPTALTREPLPRAGARWNGGAGPFMLPRDHAVRRILPPLSDTEQRVQPLRQV